MPVIKIVEQDLTSPGVLAQETDVVYIPGFVDTTQDNLNTEDGYVGLEAFKPTYFSDVKSFETLCGKQGAKFDSVQKYSDLIKKNSNGTYEGFNSKAIPQHRIMFYEGTIDPSYIMAKELLSAGLAIVYERINKDPDYVQLVEEPEDWETNYSSYYTNTVVYTPIIGSSAPEFFTKHYEGETVPDKQLNYYALADELDDNGNLVYTKLGEEDYKNSENIFIQDCYSRNDNTFYTFKHPENLVEPAFTVNTTSQGKIDAKYFELVATEKKASATFKKDTYYKIGSEITGPDNNTSIPVTYQLETSDTPTEGIKYYTLTVKGLTVEPEYWGDLSKPVYTKDSNGDFTLVEYTIAEFNFRENTYYAKNENSDMSLLEYEPLIFTPSTVYLINEHFTDKNTSEIKVPQSWFMDFVNYYEKTSNKILVDVADDGEAPKFSDFATPESTDSTEETKATNVFKLSNFIDIDTAYSGLTEVFSSDRENGLTDMGNVNIKYLTSGGYPTYEYSSGSLSNAMKTIAKLRGDCVAFIDHTNNPYRTTNPSLPNSLYATVKDDDSLNTGGEFATMFTPWMNFTRITTDDNSDGEDSPTVIQMSATFGYLLALADSLKTNASWLAVAGATRGQVPNLAQNATNTPISNGTADNMQPRDGISINAITDINPYGQTIWGNRTLKDNADKGNLTATSFLNIRHLISDVKKVCYSTAKALTFEQNNDVLWINFKSKISPTLDRMVSGYGISGYKIVRDTEYEKAAEKATLCAKVILYPTYAVEDFYITIVLKDEEVGVSE